MQRLDLWVHSADWAKLGAEFQANTYYPADVTWNGVTVRNAGIRSRGRGSRSGTKPGLRVDFDRYATGQTFLGLKSFVLDNLTQDPSGIHETVAMAFNARLGIPAPREIHVASLREQRLRRPLRASSSRSTRTCSRACSAASATTRKTTATCSSSSTRTTGASRTSAASLDPYKIRFEATTHESKSDEDKYRPIETLVRLANDTPADRVKETIGPLARYSGVHPLRRRPDVPRRHRRVPRKCRASTTSICIASRTATCTR